MLVPKYMQNGLCCVSRVGCEPTERKITLKLSTILPLCHQESSRIVVAVQTKIQLDVMYNHRVSA